MVYSHTNRLTAHFAPNVDLDGRKPASGKGGTPPISANRGTPELVIPESHYAVLGVALWESDAITIRKGARQRLNQLESLRRRGHDEDVLSDHRQRILSAAATLLDPAKRSAYDATLAYVACPKCGHPTKKPHSAGDMDGFSCSACGYAVSHPCSDGSSSTASARTRRNRILRFGRVSMAETAIGFLVTATVTITVVGIAASMLAATGLAMIKSPAMAFIVGILIVTAISACVAKGTVGLQSSTRKKSNSSTRRTAAADGGQAANSTVHVSHVGEARIERFDHNLSDIPQVESRNYYSLIGLPPFENDPQRIELALGHTLALLNQAEALSSRPDCHELVAEVHDATTTLLDGEKKDAYDDKLRLALYGSEYGFWQLLRVQVRRVQQQLGLQPAVFCFLVPLVVFGVFAIPTIAIAHSFATALLVGALFASLAAYVVFNAYFTPDPDATEPVEGSMTAMRRAMSFVVTCIACSAVVMLTGISLSAPKSFFVGIAALVVGICTTAYFAFRSSSRYTAATIDRLQRRSTPLTLVTRNTGGDPPKSVNSADAQVQPTAEWEFTSEVGDLANGEEIPWGIPINESFDPYYEWLGIPPSAQPVDHYRLIGVERFEANPDVIERLCDQRLAYLKTVCRGERVHLAQELMNEITRAKIVLLQEREKEEYDRFLRDQVAHDDVPTSDLVESSEIPVGQAVVVETHARNDRGRRGSRRRYRSRPRRRKMSLRSIAVQAILGGLVGLAIGWFILAKWVDPTWDRWGIVWPLSVSVPTDIPPATVDKEWRLDIQVSDWGKAWHENRLTFDPGRSQVYSAPKIRFGEVDPIRWTELGLE